MKSFSLKVTFICFSCLLSVFLLSIFFKPIFTSNNIILSFGIKNFYLSVDYPDLWNNIKIVYLFCYILSAIIISNSIYLNLFKKTSKTFIKRTTQEAGNNNDNLKLFLGTNEKNSEEVFLEENSLYQNILITGAIGCGKTTSAMYPFVEQLISFNSLDSKQKLGMLILDVKGNFYKEVIKYSKKYCRKDDVVLIELKGEIKYNPLHKPNLKPSVLANRLKTILTMFSKNTSDSYWLDMAEQLLTECIKLCRIYNDGYVTFLEIHKLINFSDYYLEKVAILRKLFISGKLNNFDCFNLLSSLQFFETEYGSLDSRVLSIIKSEISRITSLFISDYDILNTFSPEKNSLTFNGFDDVIKKGKIVILNMNIAEYQNLSKIIAAYLKLDFQTEILTQLSNNEISRTTLFMCDEYHEYVTSTDSNFFAQSRESKCINIVATQSYTSLLNTLKDPYAVKVILQSLINKLWFRIYDIYTIEDIQKQIGREEKTRYSKAISENAKETNYNYITKSLNSKNSNISESLSSYVQLDYIYDTSFFTLHLETFSCLAFLSDGNKILEPCKLKLLPSFEKN